MLLYERTCCETLHKEIQLSDSCDPQTCLISYENDATFGQGNQIGLRQGNLLPFKFEIKMRFWSKATRWAPNWQFCCLSSLRPRCVFGQRQPDGPPTGNSAAFGLFEQDWSFFRGNQIGLRPAYLLLLVILSKFGPSSEATRLISNRQICCL